MNETVFAVWNTSAGRNSSSSSAGENIGNYYPLHTPGKAFDGSTSSKHLNYGSCNDSASTSANLCGQNTGVYLSPKREISLLLGFRFCTADSFPERDPMIITLEGSNRPSNKLTAGSSWTLIYNGTSGLDTAPNRSTCGDIQWLPNNSVWYTSYRILVSKKRNSGNYVHYSELELFGY